MNTRRVARGVRRRSPGTARRDRLCRCRMQFWRKLYIEPLEDRRMLSAGPGAGKG